MFLRLWWLGLGTLFAQPGAAQSTVLLSDAFDDTSGWIAAASDGVGVSIRPEPGSVGAGLRANFDFQRGSGYFTLRRQVAVDLPSNWRLSLDVRGDAPPNNLEIKLIDETGENVWWVNQRSFAFRESWSHLSLKKRRFQFAWGPSGPGKPLGRLGAIEIAVAAGSGGKGSIDLDSLVLEALPETTQPGPIQVHRSPAAPEDPREEFLPASGVVNWAARLGDTQPTIELSFGVPRELGGLSLWWGAETIEDYDVELRDRDGAWQLAHRIRSSRGGTDHLPLRDAEAEALRVRVLRCRDNATARLDRIVVQSNEFSESDNAFVAAVAADSPRGLYPRQFLGQQAYWTVVGAPDDEEEALLSEDGAIELGKGGPSIEPFLAVGDARYDWSNVELTHALPDGQAPTPYVQWQADGLRLRITSFVNQREGHSTLHGLYELTNGGASPVSGTLLLALRPFQVLPMSQELNIVGGVSRNTTASGNRERLSAGQYQVTLASPSSNAGAIRFVALDKMLSAASQSGALEEAVSDELGFATAIAAYPFSLPAGSAERFAWSRELGGDPAASIEPPDVEEVVRRLAATQSEWGERLDRVRFSLPDPRYAGTFRSQVAAILINRDGPAIQPGSRSYDRTWIRDGALTSTALLYAAYPEEVRAFLDWFAPFQYDNGKIPCCVDERGPDPVPEHDSHGQYLYAVAEYDRFQHDEAFLRRHWPHVQKAVGYIDSLLATRTTDTFLHAEGLARAEYGLMPESISHEGYSAKPMHSYWDDFWALRGLEDAAFIARRLRDDEFEARAAAAADALRVNLYESMRRVFRLQGIDYIPGCVELGDFDATSTSIGVFPIGELGRIPEPQLARTFDRYAEWFGERAAGQLPWRDYTPYEIRNATTFLFLNRRQVCHEMMRFFFKDQRPAGWNSWAEVVRKGYRTPGFIGDLPHTWVGSDFVKLLRTMFVHERATDDTLVVGMGITSDWFAAPDGAHADGLPTHFGDVGLSFFTRDGARVVQLRGDLRSPTGGIELAIDDLVGSAISADGHAVDLDPAGRLRLSWPVHEVVIHPAPGEAPGTR